MGPGSLRLGLIIIILIITLSTVPTTSAQDSIILDQINEDWSTDIILLYVETPNKFDRTYGTNITDYSVLDEISRIEEILNPYKVDDGKTDMITFVLSISTLIKEIDLAPVNIVNAISEEIDPTIDPGPPPEDYRYAVPEDQDEIDKIIDDIPHETRNLFVRDTNGDDIWDSALIWIGVVSNSKDVLHDIDRLIDNYYVDPEASDSDYNSNNKWWNRIDSGTIHCSITSLDYVQSYEKFYSSQEEIAWVIIFAVMIILVGLMVLSNNFINSAENKGKIRGDMKKKVMLSLIVFVILIASNVLIGLINVSELTEEKLDRLSDEFRGGQMGMVIVYGSSAPPEDRPNKGSSSLKDIDVLDEMDNLEEEINKIRDPDDPMRQEPLTNSPMTIVDVMKMIEVPKYLVDTIPIQILPPLIQSRIEDGVNASFWDLIHTAGLYQTPLWVSQYGKSFQDSLINIFYNSITHEMRSVFINADYSRSLLYFQNPLDEESRITSMKNQINNVVDIHQSYISTSDFVLIEAEKTEFENIIFAIKIIAPFGILGIGIAVYLIIKEEIRKLDENEERQMEMAPMEPEAIFEDLTDEEYYDLGPPPPKFNS